MCANIQSGLAQTCQGVCQTGEEAVPYEGGPTLLASVALWIQYAWRHAEGCCQAIQTHMHHVANHARNRFSKDGTQCRVYLLSHPDTYAPCHRPKTQLSKDGTQCRVYLPSSPVAGICCHRLQQTCLSFCFLLPADEPAAYARGRFGLELSKGGKCAQNQC